MTDHATSQPTDRAVPQLRLSYGAVSDVGRVRRDNQDSGYAGPWLLAVCDGVGGAARGDIASATAITQLRRLDEPPPASQPGSESDEELLARVAGALHRAHDRLVELVDEDPALNGTSTTATVLAFDGHRFGVGHVGDSRAYLYRDGTIRQLTVDHTFVQTLIDEGRITEQEARVHPHRNLILRAIDAVSESEPDLFVLDAIPGDRLLVCSDGASGVLDDGRIADILGTGSPEYAAVELVRASLEAGSSDNVTCVVADVLDASDTTDVAAGTEPHAAAETEPATGLVVGAAAERRTPRGRTGGLFRGHRSGDTGELDPVPADVADGLPHAIAADPIDPETARYAPRPPRRALWARRLFAALVVVGVAWVGVAAAWSWSQQQYYVGEEDGAVVIFRGVNASIAGFDLSEPYETTDVAVDRLSDFDAGKVADGISAEDLDDARRTVQSLAENQEPESGSTTG